MPDNEIDMEDWRNALLGRGTRASSTTFETDLSGFTSEEIALSQMIVDRYAERLPDEDKPLLLHHLRTFAGAVAARHYIYGWTDGDKGAEKRAADSTAAQEPGVETP